MKGNNSYLQPTFKINYNGSEFRMYSTYLVKLAVKVQVPVVQCNIKEIILISLINHVNDTHHYSPDIFPPLSQNLQMDIYFPPPQCGAALRKNIPEGSQSHPAVHSYCRCGPLHSSAC